MVKKKSEQPAIDIAALASAHEGSTRSLYKVGKPMAKYQFESDVPVDVKIVGQENTFAPNNGQPQLTLALEVDGESAGQVWVNFPASGDEEVNDRDDKRWGEFLRALYPAQFNVYSSIDKSDDREWKYLDSDGEEIPYASREAKNAEVSAAGFELARLVRENSHSFVGLTLAFWPKTTNAGKLFMRFRAAGFSLDASED